MLQYPVQLPPLSLSSQKKPQNAAPIKDLDYPRHNDHPSAAAILNRKRRSILSSASPLSISTNLPIFPSSTSSPSTASAKLPRSPYISSVLFPPPSVAASTASQSIEDVLAPGDIVGDGFYLQGEPIRLVSNGAADLAHPEPLRNSSYAVVYLVQEVLSRPVPSEDGHMSTIGLMELDNKSIGQGASTVYGRKYAIKCLSKADLDEDAQAVQMSEVTIHQSLHLHPNIVTLHRTLETSAFLLLLLEYVPGEDLFYFLEQARDHYDLDHPTDSSVSSSHTPPTPSLLSNMHPSQLLSRTRLRLISSMFSQMCDAVAACHAQHVFHRDIKPENFIVTDGHFTSLDGRSERKVIVKLTDFGLSTTDLESADMDCGSAPYMSYECRNNVAPTYRPVLPMLYHFNPWTDTAQGSCSSFDLYLKDPVNFFMQRFNGMTKPVAEVLATKVFCLLDDQHDDSKRMSAAEFGAWARGLPTLLGGHGVHRTVSSGSATQGHRLSLSIPMSHRPSSRHPSSAGTATAVRTTPAMPRARSHDNEDDDEGDIEIEGMTSRSTSTNKRRKRGARKGKGTLAAGVVVPADTTLLTLAAASQSLAREISMASKSTLVASVAAPEPAPAPAPAPATPVTKKPSKWKLGFGKNTSSNANAAPPAGRISPVEEVASPPTSLDLSPSQAMATTASNVTSLLMGLNAPPAPLSAVSASASRVELESSPSSSSTWSRGRRARDSPVRAAALGVDAAAARRNPSRSPGYALSSNSASNNRAVSPNSTRSGGRPVVSSSASSVVSSNWRSSMSTSSSAGTSTSAFTRYSNSSARSVSTTATTVVDVFSSGAAATGYSRDNIPKNIKIMDGVPWELDQLPRGQHPNPVGDIFGSPPLDTINERGPSGSGPTSAGHHHPKSPENLRRDASTSTTDLAGAAGGKDDNGEGVKKVQKGQINALAKMLSALRR
ncbi:hypothetical protein BDZ97DRAFT_1901747 [Flammula alnicola]|nr:hypothetical protein BDZ97DRAFT_1901747 [Flammula alnicola]